MALTVWAVLAEDRRPPVSLWQETLVSSALLEYEVLKLETYPLD